MLLAALLATRLPIKKISIFYRRLTQNLAA
jgi:hypothetical protein